ncbi:MAG: hypothetical protein AAGF89_08175 [Bacteroidota bacterium]
MIHEATIPHFGKDWNRLAKELGDLRYDELADFLHALSDKINLDGDQDAARQRVKLARELHTAAQGLKESSAAIQRAWIICEPFMNGQ